MQLFCNDSIVNISSHDWYSLGNYVLYHKKALCTKKKPNIPWSEGDREARS